MMKTPNFFFAGAAKSGTSSLTHYLSSHPQIFITSPRETYFYSQDIAYQALPANNEEEYLSLFKDAQPEHIRRGEATISYLYSESAVPQIAHRYPDAKLFAVLRNPIEMVPALHDQFVYNGIEDITSFQAAWEASDLRCNGESLPKGVRNGKILNYRSIAKYGEQLERVFEYFPREQVRAYSFDEFVANPGAVYLKILEFLEVDPILPSELPKLNVRKSVRLKFIPSLLRQNPMWLRLLKRASHATLGKSTGVLNWLVKKNTIAKGKAPIDQAIHEELVNEYSDDVAKLCRLTNGTFEDWLTVFSS